MHLPKIHLLLAATLLALTSSAPADEKTDKPAEPQLKKACIDGTGPGWREMTLDDFVNVNCNEHTWSMKDGVIHCTGQPIGVTRTKNKVKNFELVVEWRHLKPAGNSGVFCWAMDEPLMSLEPGKLPHGIEVQILDPGYKTQYEERTKKVADWFTGHGDVFHVGAAKLKPFAPTSPNGARSFPRKELTKPSPEWNHYYVRGVNGEIRLWVNGEEVSGGTGAQPAEGYLCLESEGSPVEFRNFRIRELP